MWEVSIIIVGFLVAVVTLLREEGHYSILKALRNVSGSGKVLLVLAVIGIIAALAKTAADSSAARETAKKAQEAEIRAQQTEALLQKTYDGVAALQSRSTDPTAIVGLRAISDTIAHSGLLDLIGKPTPIVEQRLAGEWRVTAHGADGGTATLQLRPDQTYMLADAAVVPRLGQAGSWRFVGDRRELLFLPQGSNPVGLQLSEQELRDEAFDTQLSDGRSYTFKRLSPNARQ